MRSAALLGFAVALCLPAHTAAQVVHGRVTATGSAAPVSGAVVTLLDSAGAVAGRTMSDSAGGYRLVAGRPGLFRVRAQRIGYRPVTSPGVRVTLADVQLPVSMPAVALALEAIRVAGRDVCGNIGDSTGATFALWEQTRAALVAAQVTSRMRGLGATVVMYERTLDPQNRRIRDQTARVSSGFVTEPWRSVPIATLRREGYVATEASGWVVYRVPGLDVLLSDAFIEDHCFRVIQPRDRRLIGIAFEPTRDRREIPEVRGTIWLDRGTHALRNMTFGYVNIPREQEGEAGGELEFAQLKDGGWAVSRWHVDMPVLEQQMVSGRAQLRVVEIKVAGGDLSVATRGTDTLWARPPMRFVGVVTDSASRSAVPGATVALEGTSASTRTDDRGHFTLTGVIPGAYTLTARTPAFDSAGVRHEQAVVVADGSEPLQVRLPGVARLVAALPASARVAELAGVVRGDSAHAPLPDAEITLPALGRSVMTGADGSYRMGDIPAGLHRVSVRKVGYTPVDTTIVFVARESGRWDLALRRTQMLDTVRVRAVSLIPSFDEHRELGRGHFFTREELARMTNRPMSSVLADLPSARLVPLQGSGAIVATRRRSMATYRQIDPGNPAAKVLEQGFCPATVFLNNAAVYSGAPGEPPFNVNSLAPDDIEAIEYYASANEVPPRYAGKNVECGVLVIHTRRGRR